MNELFQQLADQAEKYADDNFKGEPFWTQAYESKFAELIVRECANFSDKGTRGGIGELMKKHFGVEE